MPTDAGPADAARPLRVTVVHRPPSSHLRHVDQIVGEGGSPVTFRFGRKSLQEHESDVVHLPRSTSLHGDNAPTGPRLVRATLDFTTDLKRRRIALVRTLHGHDRVPPRGRWERLAAWVLDRATTTFVVLDDSAPQPASARTTVIRHGHFRDRFTGYPRSERAEGRLLVVGLVPLADGAGDVAEAFREATVPGLTLHVVGPAAKGLTRRLEEAVGADPRLSARLEFVSTGSMVSELTAAELVVVPGVDELEDLTVLFAALSLDRPVLVPDGPTARALAAANGSEWVRCYTGPLTGATVDAAIGALRAAPPQGRPQLDGEDLDATGARYAAVYAAAAQKVRGA